MNKKILLGFFCLSSLLFAKTEFTGETYLGRKVITNLDVSDLDKGKTYEFYFKGAENSLGQPWYLPVTVIKGKNGDEKFLINAGIHGNELNSLLTTYKVKEKLNPNNVNGTITIVHSVNIPGLLNNTRGYKFNGGAEDTSDLNRQMDSGKTTYSDQIHSTLVWENLLSKNADKAIDLHTNGKGSSFPLFAYADFRNEDIKKMAELLGADVVKMDNGEPGSVETSFVSDGIPAVTFEIGTSEAVQPNLVERATQGVINNLVYWKFLTDEKVDVQTDSFYGNYWSRIRAEKGGYIEPKVKLMDKVNKGDLVYVQYDAFGKKIKEYFAVNSGVVVSLKDYPLCEPGDSLIRVIEYNPNDKDQVLKK